MRKSKKIYACLFIGIGILLLPFSIIKGFPAAFIVLALYSAICKADMVGCMIAVGIFLLSHIVYAVCFKYFDNH